MFKPVLFRNRSRPAQILIGGVIPAVIGAIAGILVGVSAPAYWMIGVLAGIGAFVAGFEHRDGWGGADRGMVGGAIYGAALLGAHRSQGLKRKCHWEAFRRSWPCSPRSSGSCWAPPAGGSRALRERSATSETAH